MGPEVSLGKKIGKSCQNHPILVLIFWGSIPCVFCLYCALLKAVSHYDLSILPMSGMGLKKIGYGVRGYPVLNIGFFRIV